MIFLSSFYFKQPVNGGFSDWVNSGVCSHTCGTEGLQRQVRTCTNPPPQHGGLTCQQNPAITDKRTEQFIECNRNKCPGTCRSSIPIFSLFFSFSLQKEIPQNVHVIQQCCKKCLTMFSGTFFEGFS